MEVNNSSAVPVQGAENSSQPTGSAAATETPVSVPAPTCTEGKKKRGRPKKYGPDGTVIYHQAAALSPMPISASIPLTGDFPTWKPSRGRSVDSFKKKHKLLEFESPGERLAYSVGANFTPHVLTVNAGEDVNMKVISFSQQGSRAICILSANGAVSNVTLRQPNSSGGTLTYEGRFEILSLTGSFMPTDTGGTKSRTGGMSVSLAGPDGRVYGGGLAGLLIAAGPVQVVIGSFLPGHRQEQKPKKPRFEPNSTIYSPSLLNHQSGEAVGGSFGGQHRVIPNSVHVPNSLPSENVIHFQGSESNDHNRSPKFDVFQGSESNDHNRSPKFDVFQGSESNDHNRSPKFNIFQGSESNDHNRSSKFDVFQGAESNDHNRSSKFDVFQGSESTDHNRSPKFNISC